MVVDEDESVGPSALFELALDGGAEAERISRRPLAGVWDRQLRDPEGLARVDLHGEIVLIVAFSLCIKGGNRSDGLVRARYSPHGDLHAESMAGFRAWLLDHQPWLAAAGDREPDAGGLNIEGLEWDPRAGVLLFGLRGRLHLDTSRSSGSRSTPAGHRGLHRHSDRRPLSASAYRNQLQNRVSATSPTMSRLTNS